MCEPGTITNIKVGSLLPGSVNSFDFCAITLQEDAASGGASWLFYLWVSPDGVPALQRVLQTQRLALAREAAFRQAEIRRLALALGQARQQLRDNRAQLLAIVEDIAPGLTSRFGIGPVSAAQAIVSFSHPGRCRSEAAVAALGGTSPVMLQNRNMPRGVTWYSVPAAARTPRAAQLERGTEVTVNAIMGFQVMALIWLGLTVAAAIAGGIAHRPSSH